MILVTGASGTVGRELSKKLSEQGVRFRAGYRTRPEQVRLPGAEPVHLDYERPETIRPALKGVEAVFLLSNAISPEAEIVKEAKQAGVKRIVKLSVYAADKEEFTFARWHRAIEKVVEASGLAWTFLRPNGFMQNIPNYMGKTIKEQGVIHEPAGDARIAHIDARDIGEVAARVLTSSGHDGKAYTLTGPEAISYGDIAATLTKVLGRPIQYVDISLEDFKKGSVAAGIPEGYADALVDLNRYYVQGKAAQVIDTVRHLTGRPPRSFETFARDHADLLR